VCVAFNLIDKLWIKNYHLLYIGYDGMILNCIAIFFMVPRVSLEVGSQENHRIPGGQGMPRDHISWWVWAAKEYDFLGG
jgi:hypothetical protein